METDTGSYICLGVVFSADAKTDIQNCIRSIIDRFPSERYILTNYSERTDEGREWTRNRISQSDFELLRNPDNFTVTFETEYRGKKTQIILSNAKLENFVAVQIDFHEASFTECCGGNPRAVADVIGQLCMELHRNMHFEYAYCDAEANFDWTPSTVRKSGHHLCSLTFFPCNQGLKVIRQPWELDGMTARPADLVGEFWLK